MIKQITFVAFALVLAACSHDEPPVPAPLQPSQPAPSGAPSNDPYALHDTYEREVKRDCSGAIVSDTLVRHAASSQIKINPNNNVYIAAVSFFNLDNGDEFTPSGVLFPGNGGDNLKIATFCQVPQPDFNCLAVHAGDNQIQYKYWSHENPDTIAEIGTRTLHFTVSSETSAKTCTRTQVTCPQGANSNWSNCQY